MDWITEVLSQLTVRQPSCKLLLASHTTTSSITTASAQPMSRPFEFHPGVRYHADQRLSMRIPTLTDIEASTHISRSRAGRGVRDRVGLGTVRVQDHHLSSCMTFVGMW